MPRLLIVSASPETASLYRKSVEEKGGMCEMARSITEMFERMLHVPFNGLLIDVPTVIKASEKEKSLLQIVTDIYPTLRVRWDVKAGRMRGLLLGQNLNTADPLKDYLDRFCSSQPARTCRREKRHAVHLNALLSSENTFPPDRTEKVFSLDISEGGCFLFSSQSWRQEDTAWVRFVELSDPQPIQLEIRRCIRWGESTQIPGIGVRFKSLRPGQLQEIRQFLARG